MVNDDLRLRDLIKVKEWPWDSKDLDDDDRLVVVIVGFPFDEGVKRNGGVVGACHGPQAFRQQLYKIGTLYNPELKIDIPSRVCIIDSGDVEGDTLEHAHENLQSRVSMLLSLDYIPFIIGGGNDQSSSNGRAFLSQFSTSRVGIINIDAHLDVRPLKNGQIHSGSPFRELLEHGLWKSSNHFVEFACQGEQCSQAHAQYVLEKGGRLAWLSEIQENVVSHFMSNLKGCEHWFVSFDLDSICSRDCPGVSCPGVIGLKSEQSLQICMKAGSDDKVRLFDVSELNPEVEQLRSSRLVAMMFYYFVLGVAQRKV